MVEITRKQREVQERESRILAVARPLVVTEGYHGLSMDKVAEAIEYSKGTIYNHFGCKEEIILALAIETMRIRTDMFQRAIAFNGRPRERMQAIGVAAELFARLYSDHFGVELLIRLASIWEKTSQERRVQFHAAETRCLTAVTGIAQDAISRQDLVLPVGLSAEEMVFGLWSLTFGAYSMIATNSNLRQLGIENPFEAVREHCSRLLDGYAWQPLSSEWDYPAVIAKIGQEIFLKEWESVFAVN